VEVGRLLNRRRPLEEAFCGAQWYGDDVVNAPNQPSVQLFSWLTAAAWAR